MAELQMQSRAEHVSVQLDKPFYKSGDKIRGILQLNLSKTTKLRSLEVYLHGFEKVVIDPPYAGGAHKANYSSTNEMLNFGLRLLQETVLQPGARSFPFEFDLPPDALPSYVGRYAHVIWRLSVRGDVPWGMDLKQDVFLSVKTILPSGAPTVLENPDEKPKIRLAFSSNHYQPSETVEGKVTMLRQDNLKTVRLNLVSREDAMAKSTFSTAHKTQDWKIGQTLEIPREQLSPDAETPFSFQIPNDAPLSYQGVYSSVSWYVMATLNRHLAEDMQVYAPMIVGIRVAVTEPSEQAAVAAPVQQAKPEVAATLTTPPDVETTHMVVPEVAADKEQLIIEILSDGSAKELIEISSELQVKSQEFLGVDAVRELCEDLVSRGQLKRTGEGEYFAKYSLVTPS